MQQVQEIEYDIDSSKEILKQVDVSVKLLLASFEDKSRIVNVTDQSSEITMVRLPKIPLPSLGEWLL